MSSSLTVLAAGHLDVVARSDLAAAGAVPAGLLEALAQVPDPRDPRGVRYDLVPVLAVAVCATLAGARSYAAIAEWADDAGPELRSGLGLPGAQPGPGDDLAGADPRGAGGPSLCSLEA